MMHTKKRARLRKLAKDLTVDAVITAAIVGGLVYLGEPLRDILTSPIFIVLVGGGLIRIFYKAFGSRVAADD